MKRSIVKVLVLNWRDPWHPKAGGAELMTLRLLEHLVRRGWKVEWFSGHYVGASEVEMRNGIRYVRRGTQTSVHWHAYRYYRHQQDFDVVVDEINTIPFFAPLYFQAPTIALMYQLAREVWFYEAALPLAIAGYLLEPFYLQAYRNIPIVTISQSSAESFEKLGLRGAKYIVPISCDEEPAKEVLKKTIPRDIVVVSRVTPSKRIHHAIEAARILAARGWAGHLHIVGGGDKKYVARLKALAERLIPGRVRFHGYVDNCQRTRLLSDASAIWMMSRREGWGLVITEAARRSTPAVVYDVPGLRDAVRHGETGFVTQATPLALALATEQLLSERYETFSAAALTTSQEYSWENSGAAFENVLLQYARTRSTLS